MTHLTKWLVAVLLLGLGLGLSACATTGGVRLDETRLGNPEPEEAKVPPQDHSAWTPTPRYPDYLVAVGSAPLTWDRDFTYTMAYTAALRNLALRRRALVLSLIERFQEAGLLGPAQGVGVRGSVDYYGKVVDRLVTAEQLRDVTVLAERTVKGSLELLVGVKWESLKGQVSEDVRSALEEAAPQALEELRRRNEEGQRELDRRLEEYLQAYRQRLGR